MPLSDILDPVFSDVLDDQYGRPIAGAEAWVYSVVNSITGPLAALRDVNTNAPIDNPTRSNDRGVVQFRADPGTYRVDYRVGGISLLIKEVIVGNPPQYIGETGPANSTYTTLDALKAAAVTNASYIFAPPSGSDSGAAAGTFLYQTAGAPYTADGVNVVKLDAVPLSTGALVRQGDNTTVFVQSGAGAVPRTSRSKAQERVSVKDFGAKGDTLVLAGGAMTSGSSTLTVAGAAFTTADVGKRVAVIGPGFNLTTTITARVSATSVTLAAPAPQAIASAEVWYGTDDTAAIQTALAASPGVDFPEGVYFHSRLVLKFDKQIMRGRSLEATKLFCPVGYAFTNYSGSDSDPIGADWVGAPVFEHMRLCGGFRHTDKFAAPDNSWAFSTGRAKPFTTANINAGVRLKRCYPYTLRHVWIEGFHRGVYLSAAALGRWQDFRVAQCEYGCYAENGTVWGDPAWQVTTHNWRDGRFSECWVGIGGSDYVQCQVYKKTVDFEPCNTGIAIFNGGDNVWSGYFELCSEGIYRNGSFMGHDVIEDPFFGGRPNAFWGMGDSILLDNGIGATGGVTLRCGTGPITGGGIRVLGGRFSRPETHTGSLLFLSAPITPAAGFVDTDMTWIKGSGYDDAGVIDPGNPAAIRIGSNLAGATIRLTASLPISGDSAPNEVSAWFEKNGNPFPGTGRFAQVYTFGAQAMFTSAPITVVAGDVFTAVVKMNLARQINTGNDAWISVEVLG